MSRWKRTGRTPPPVPADVPPEYADAYLAGFQRGYDEVVAPLEPDDEVAPTATAPALRPLPRPRAKPEPAPPRPASATPPQPPPPLAAPAPLPTPPPRAPEPEPEPTPPAARQEPPLEPTPPAARQEPPLEQSPEPPPVPVARVETSPEPPAEGFVPWQFEPPTEQPEATRTRAPIWSFEPPDEPSTAEVVDDPAEADVPWAEESSPEPLGWAFDTPVESTSELHLDLDRYEPSAPAPARPAPGAEVTEVTDPGEVAGADAAPRRRSRWVLLGVFVVVLLVLMVVAYFAGMAFSTLVDTSGPLGVVPGAGASSSG